MFMLQCILKWHYFQQFNKHWVPFPPQNHFILRARLVSLCCDVTANCPPGAPVWQRLLGKHFFFLFLLFILYLQQPPPTCNFEMLLAKYTRETSGNWLCLWTASFGPSLCNGPAGDFLNYACVKKRCGERGRLLKRYKTWVKTDTIQRSLSVSRQRSVSLKDNSPGVVRDTFKYSSRRGSGHVCWGCIRVRVGR